jgi:hypothetical protein
MKNEAEKLRRPTLKDIQNAIRMLDSVGREKVQFVLGGIIFDETKFAFRALEILLSKPSREEIGAAFKAGNRKLSPIEKRNAMRDYIFARIEG